MQKNGRRCGEPVPLGKNLAAPACPRPKRYGYGYGLRSAKRGPLPFLTQHPAGRQAGVPPPPLPRPLARRSSSPRAWADADCSE